MLCHGPARAGKSTLMRHLVETVESTGSAVAFHCHIPGTGGSAREYPAVASWLYESRGGKSPFSQQSNATALVNRVEVDAISKGTRRVVFLVDDAHLLELGQLNGLKSLAETLVNRKLSPFILLLAQPEIFGAKGLEQKVMAAGNFSLIDRFFLRKHRLRGLRLDEFPVVLSRYDESRWPLDNGPTYCAHFLPELCAQGWTMAAQAKHFQNAFRRLAQQFHRDPDDIATKFLISSANALLTNAKATLGARAGLGALIDVVVRDCGIVQSYELGDIEQKVRNLIPAPVRGRPRAAQP